MITPISPAKLVLPLFIGLVFLAGCGGASSAPATVVAPADLSYSQPTLAVTVGQAIQVDAPTLQGVVTSYSVSPALPGGLSLNAGTGVISGAPTVSVPQTTYTVTASNAAGSTSASVIITVANLVIAPSGLSYAQSTLSVTVGHAVTADAPTVSGTPASFAVSPSLPTGLSINSTTGVISGTPTTSALSTAYTVTASNSAGSTTASLTIAVLNTQTVLLDLGQAGSIDKVLVTPTRVLEQDGVLASLAASAQTGHWALYDYAAKTKIANGTQSYGGVVDMAGSIFVVESAQSTLNVRSAIDGSLTATIATQYLWWKLASDGSYIVTGSATGLSIYATDGALIVSHAGNYASGAQAYAAPNQVQIAGGPAGTNVIETVSTTMGTSMVSPVFAGSFYAWFSDGGHFFSAIGSTVYTYSSAGVEQGINTIATNASALLPGNLGGTGNWLYYTSVNSPNPTTTLQIFAIGSSAPAATFLLNTISYETMGLGGSTIVAAYSLGIASTTVTTIDLSGPTPIRQDYALAGADYLYLSAFGSVSASQFVVGNQTGLLQDGTSLGTANNRFFGIGSIPSIAAGTTYAALATIENTILPFSSATLAALPPIDFQGSSPFLSMSSDGTTLAAAQPIPQFSYTVAWAPGDGTTLLSMPSGSVLSNWPNSSSIVLSGSGSVLEQAAYTSSGSGYTYVQETVPAQGGIATALQPVQVASAPSITPPASLPLSPDGTLAAIPSTYATAIEKNGGVIAAYAGQAVGWLDNNRLLVNIFGAISRPGELPPYQSTAIVSPAGSVLGTPSLPQISSFQVVNSDQIYVPATNTIFSVTSGKAVWMGNQPSNGTGAVAGSYVIYVSGSQVLAEGH